jgi:hypothetical protein
VKVRSEPKYVRRRRIALLVVLAVLLLLGLGISRVVGAFADRGAAAAPVTRAPVDAGLATAASPRAPAVPAPTPSPTEPQGEPGPSAETALVRILRLTGGLTPKSDVASEQGLVFAQNMMYKHTVSAFRADGALVRTISDSVRLADLGVAGHPGSSRGAPVEMAFSPDGKHA